MLHVRHALVCVGRKILLDTPKTRKAARTVSLPAMALTSLAVHRHHQRHRGRQHPSSRPLLDCGLRPEEVYRLRWEQVQNGVVQIMTGKTRNAKRRIPMSQRAAALEMRRSWVESEWVFPADAECGHIGPSTLKKQHAKALRLSSVNPFVFYILRHTCLSRWAGGLDPFLLKSLAGHGSIVTTQRYIHLSDEQSFAALEKVRGGHNIGHTANVDQNERPAEAGLLN